MKHYSLIPGVFLHEVVEEDPDTSRIRSKVDCHECLFQMNGRRVPIYNPVPQPEENHEPRTWVKSEGHPR